MYHKLTEEDVRFLETAAPSRVMTGKEIQEEYWHDEMGQIEGAPEAVVKVLTTGEISSIMAYANEKRIPVVARGSGTGLVGGAVAVYGGIVLDMTGMNQILKLEKETASVTVQPGVLLMDLAEFVETEGFLYPPDPGEKSATIGGNISTNAGGMRAVKYGVTRDYVRSLKVVLSDGTVQMLGGNVAKNSTGYSLKDLVIGSEGTLAVVAEATLRLVPLPACSMSLLVPFASMDAAIQAVPAILKSNHTPTAVEYMDREVILCAENYLGKKFPDSGSDAYLLLTADGSSKERTGQDLDQLAQQCLLQGALDAYLVDTKERKDSVWSARGAFLEGIKASTTEMDECDVVVPVNCVARFLHFVHDMAEDTGIRILSFGHAGDGNLHVYLCRDSIPDGIWEEKLLDCFEKMYQEAASMGGLVSGEHGIGWAKRRYMEEQLKDVQLTLMRGIKAVFDPNHILNPGKVCDRKRES